MTKRDRAIAIGAGAVLCIILAFSIYQGVKARQENNGPAVPSSTYIPISSESVSSEESSVSVSSSVSFYISQSPDLLTQLEEGDFSNLKEIKEGIRVSTVERIVNVYKAGIVNKFNEFRRYDLNGDGVDELIWQEKDGYYNGNMKPIIGIFVQESGKTKCVLWDTEDASEYYFLSPAGNMVYYYLDYGITGHDIYRYHIFDKEWYPEYQYELDICWVNETTLDSDPEWKTKNPDMQKVGVYYSKYTETGKEISKDRKKEVLTEQQFRAKFKKLMGVDFDEMKPEWFDAYRK